MIITNIETYLHFSTWRNLILIRVDTDAGLTGIGEATMRNKEKAVYEAIQSHMAPRLLGKDVHAVNRLFSEEYVQDPWRSGSGGAVFLSAISGIEMALWDIIGQEAGEPVYNLWGGAVRNKIRLYANKWFDGCSTSDDFVAAAKRTVDAGFTALKWNPLLSSGKNSDRRKMEDALANVFAMRSALGPSIDLCIELHGNLHYDDAVIFVTRVRDANVLFVEEPMLPDDKAGFQKLVALSEVPIAAGERVFTRYGYKYYIEDGAHSVAQPDITHTGGLLETKFISAMLDTAGMKIAPHNSNSIVATAAAAALDATMPNFLIQEMMLDVLDLNRTLLKTPVLVENGHMVLSGKPGLGLDPDWDAIKSVGYRPAFSKFFQVRT